MVMHEALFKSEMLKARTLRERGERADYWLGYERGLRRGFHGAQFGTEQDHENWLSLAADPEDRTRRERGQGYRDGLAATVSAARNGASAIFGGSGNAHTSDPVIAALERIAGRPSVLGEHQDGAGHPPPTTRG
jgi:hypothetical protein